MPSAALDCSPRDACAAAVAAAAPFDSQLYAELAARFEQRVRRAGALFQVRLAAFRAVRAAVARAPLRARTLPRAMHAVKVLRPNPRRSVDMRKHRCPIEDGAALCLLVHADTAFARGWTVSDSECCTQVSRCTAGAQNQSGEGPCLAEWRPPRPGRRASLDPSPQLSCESVCRLRWEPERAAREERSVESALTGATSQRERGSKVRAQRRRPERNRTSPTHAAVHTRTHRVGRRANKAKA